MTRTTPRKAANPGPGLPRFRVGHGHAVILLGLLTAFTSPRTTCAAGIELSGYYENTLQGSYTEEIDPQILNANKLRLDFGSGFAEQEIELKADLVAIAYSGARTFDIEPYLPDAVTAQFRSLGLPVTMSFPGRRLYLDNAYLTWRHGGWRFRAGRQQLSWGPGYSYNPTDLFHRKDILDPTYEKEGVNALRLEYRWGIGGQAVLIAAPGATPATTGYALRLGTHVTSIGYDVAVTLHQVEDSTSVSPLTLLPRIQRRRAAGLEFSGELLGLGFWFEGNYNEMENEDDFHRFIAGLDYTLENGLYLMAEVLVNDRGDEVKPYPAEDWLANLAYGEPVGAGWLLAGLRKEISDLATGSLFLFAAGDGNLMVNPRINVSIAQNADLTLFGALTTGDEDGAFPPGLLTLFARGTVYF